MKLASRSEPTSAVGGMTRLLLVLSIPLGACQSAPVEIDLGGATLTVNQEPNLVSDRFTFFAGGPAESFDVVLHVVDGNEACPLVARTGSGTETAMITTAGFHTVSFRGNVGVLSMESEGLVVPPSMNAMSMTIHNQAGYHPPVFETELADRVRSMPLELGRPVELGFPAEGATYFCSLSGIAGRDLEITLDLGDGNPDTEVIMTTDPTIGFLLTDVGADFVIAPGSGGFAFAEIPEHRDEMFLTVRATPGERPQLGRLCVKEAAAGAALFPVSVRVWSVQPMTDQLLSSLSASLRAANREIYRVSAGRTRISSVAIHSSVASMDKLVDDVYVVPPPAAGLGTPPVPLPAGPTAFVMEFPPAAAVDSRMLARAILNASLGLPFEHTFGEAEPCPNSFMGLNAHVLCWSGNHDPFNSAELGPLSAWEHLGAAADIPAPGPRPSMTLRAKSAVQVPLQIDVF